MTQPIESSPKPQGGSPPPDRPFDAEELAALDQEDVQAGRVMARLLCFFFLYTVVVTALAGWWTWAAIQ
ncbi:MAG: hypothetical protein WBC44_13640 [Planctomycetaceae bacterium]